MLDDMHPNDSQIKEFLGAERLAPNILSSKIITEFALRNGQLRESLYLTSLIGEAIFRRDIFHGNVSDELKDFVSRDDVQARVESDPDVLKYIRDRKESFDQAHGIIAVVYTGSKEALPIAFKITTKDTDKDKGVFDLTSKSNQKIQDWSEHLLHIAKGKYAKLNNVTISAPLGPFRAMLDGRSHMLALAIAMDRYIDASHHPKKATEVIATGEIDNDIIKGVEELKEKQELAQKMGAKFVTIPKGNVTADFEVKESERLDSFIKRWNKNFGPNLLWKLLEFLKGNFYSITVLCLLLFVCTGLYFSLNSPVNLDEYSHKLQCPDKSCGGLMYYAPEGDKPKFRCTHGRLEDEKCKVKFAVRKQDILCYAHSERFITSDNKGHWLCSFGKPCEVKFADPVLTQSIRNENYTGKIKCPNHLNGCNGYLKRKPGRFGLFYSCSEWPSSDCRGVDFPLRCPKQAKESEVKLLELRDVNGTNKWVCPNFPSCDYSLEAFDHETN